TASNVSEFGHVASGPRRFHFENKTTVAVPWQTGDCDNMSRQTVEQREKRTKVVTDARAYKAKIDAENRSWTDAEETQLKTMLSDAAKMLRSIELEEDLEQAERDSAAKASEGERKREPNPDGETYASHYRSSGENRGKGVRGSEEYRRHFEHFLRTGERSDPNVENRS